LEDVADAVRFVVGEDAGFLNGMVLGVNGGLWTRMSSAAESVAPPLTRKWARVDIIAWSIVAVVTAMRAVAAFNVPLIGDEGYYWEWARHLALGYSDHPARRRVYHLRL